MHKLSKTLQSVLFLSANNMFLILNDWGKCNVYILSDVFWCNPAVETLIQQLYKTQNHKGSCTACQHVHSCFFLVNHFLVRLICALCHRLVHIPFSLTAVRSKWKCDWMVFCSSEYMWHDWLQLIRLFTCDKRQFLVLSNHFFCFCLGKFVIISRDSKYRG